MPPKFVAVPLVVLKHTFQFRVFRQDSFHLRDVELRDLDEDLAEAPGSKQVIDEQLSRLGTRPASGVRMNRNSHVTVA